LESVLELKCKECGRTFSPDAYHVCDYCFGPLEVIYDYERISRQLSREIIESGPRSIWRYQSLLPVGDTRPVDMGAGFTPLVRAERLGAELGIKELYLKDDTRNPTGSFKDRVVSVALTKARQLGFKVAACASTGNLANSVAAHCAFSGFDSYIFIPANLESAKIITTAVYGPKLVAINGNYDDVNRLCAELSAEYPDWAFVNVNVRPYYAEGSKTLAFETAEQLGWEIPDHVVVPVASGSQLTKVYKGFEELIKVGLVKEKPDLKISGAQALGCSPVVYAFENKLDHIRPVKPDTIAKSLAIGDPADGYYALNTVRKTGGDLIASSDNEIIEAIKLLARTEGIFAETAGGVTISALEKLAQKGAFKSGEKVVAMVTGHGLKTTEALNLSPTFTIDPDIDIFLEMIGDKNGN
jgi:threonine synthase